MVRLRFPVWVSVWVWVWVRVCVWVRSGGGGGGGDERIGAIRIDPSRCSFLRSHGRSGPFQPLRRWWCFIVDSGSC